LARICAPYEVAEQRRGVGVAALADAVDVVALQQPVDALLDGVGVSALELGGELRDLELLTAEVGGDLLRDIGFERDAGVGGWSYQGKRSRTWLVLACGLEGEIAELTTPYGTLRKIRKKS
jgi:hypothetical protein